MNVCRTVRLNSKMRWDGVSVALILPGRESVADRKLVTSLEPFSQWNFKIKFFSPHYLWV